MLGRALQNCVGRNLIIHDHGTPTGRVSLRADDGAEVNLTALFQDLEENLHFTLIAQSVEQEVIQDEKRGTADTLVLTIPIPFRPAQSRR